MFYIGEEGHKPKRIQEYACEHILALITRGKKKRRNIMGFDFNAFNAARPGMRPSRPGGEKASMYSRSGNNSIGNCLAYGKRPGFDYNAHHAARSGTRPHRPGI